MVLEDLELAKEKTKILDGHEYNETSSIYKFTNEFLCGCNYLFKDKEKAFIITASSDQILTAILNGCKNIDTLDISRFAKYFFYLKKAGIEVLSNYDYFEYFFSNHKYDLKKDAKVMLKVINNLENEAYYFFDGLFSTFSWEEIYESNLFVEPDKEPMSEIRKKIHYLKDMNYYRLRENLKDVNIKTYTGNIMDFKPTEYYDLVYLSNIGQYLDTKEYLKVLKRFKSKLIVNYFFGIYNSERILYEKDNYKYIVLPNYDEIMIKNNDEIMIKNN